MIAVSYTFASGTYRCYADCILELMKTIVISFSCFVIVSMLIGLSTYNQKDLDPLEDQVSSLKSEARQAFLSSVAIPLGGNAQVTSQMGPEVSLSYGLTNWTISASVIKAYFRKSSPGQLSIALRTKVMSSGESKVMVGVKGFKSRVVTLKETDF